MGKRVEVSTMEGSYWRGFGGEQSPSDLATALQLIHRLFATRVQPVPAELATCLRSDSRNQGIGVRDPAPATWRPRCSSSTACSPRACSRCPPSWRPASGPTPGVRV